MWVHLTGKGSTVAFKNGSYVFAFPKKLELRLLDIYWPFKRIIHPTN